MNPGVTSLQAILTAVSMRFHVPNLVRVHAFLHLLTSSHSVATVDSCHGGRPQPTGSKLFLIRIEKQPRSRHRSRLCPREGRQEDHSLRLPVPADSGTHSHLV